jgi:hypothetical protein
MKGAVVKTSLPGVWLVTVLAGGAGMVVSFAYLASRHHLDVLAGVAGFIAGAVLIGSGLVSMAILAARGQEAPHGLPPDDEWRVKTSR